MENWHGLPERIRHDIRHKRCKQFRMPCPHRDEHECASSLARLLLICRWLVGSLLTDDARFDSPLFLRRLPQGGVHLHVLRSRPAVLRRWLRRCRSLPVA